MNAGIRFGMQRLMSYQGIRGTTFADAHLLINSFKDVTQLYILQASFEWLHGDLISVKRNGKNKLLSIKWQKF